jgi:branched-chain amino acid transport system ATP-binding protein
MLEMLSGLNAWYGESHILHGVSFEVREGEVVTLLGRNGAGKTTTLKSVMGLVGAARAVRSVSPANRDIRAVQPDRPRRHRLLSGGARHFRQLDVTRRTCCCRR